MLDRIVIIGSINVDLILRTPQLPVPGETVLGEDVCTAGGGKGANQAVAAARLGGMVSLVGRVGTDSYGTLHLENFKNEGVDIEQIRVDPEKPSGIAVILVEESGQNSIVVSPGANASVNLLDLHAASDLIQNAAAVVMQLEIPLETVLAAAEMAFTDGVPVYLNPAPAMKLPNALLRCVDTLVVNESEMELISGINLKDEFALQKSVDKLLHLGIKTIILTRGGEGVTWFTKKESQSLPAYAVEVVDTTAAGDCFMGAFAVAITEGKDLNTAIQFATAASALAVTKLGAQPSLPTRVEVEGFLKKVS